MNDFAKYLHNSIADKNAEIVKATKTLSNNHAIIIAMKCEINVMREVENHYTSFTNSTEGKDSEG